VALARNNPSLEYLFGVFEDDEKKIKEEIQKFHPRFRDALYKGSSGNSDANTAYGFDADGNETMWLNGSFSGGSDYDNDLDYDDDDYDFDGSDFDVFDGYGGLGNFGIFDIFPPFNVDMESDDELMED